LLAATFGLAYPQISDTTSPTLAEDLNDLGSVHFDQARLLDAERCFDEAISIWTKRGSSSPKIGFAFLNLAQLRVEQNRPSDGEKLFRRAREIPGSAFGAGSVELASANIGLANALMHLHRTAEAKRPPAWRSRLLKREQIPNISAPLCFFWPKPLGSSAAATTPRPSCGGRSKCGGPCSAHNILRLLRDWYAAELLLEKHSSESGKLLREALDVFESQLGPHHPYTGSTLLLYSRYLKPHGEKREAGKLRRRAGAIWAEYLRVNQLGRTLDVNAFEPTRTGHNP
jgi:hypothetical protein